MTVDLDQLIGPDNGGPTMAEILAKPADHQLHPDGDGDHWHGQPAPVAPDLTVWPWNETAT